MLTKIAKLMEEELQDHPVCPVCGEADENWQSYAETLTQDHLLEFKCRCGTKYYSKVHVYYTFESYTEETRLEAVIDTYRERVQTLENSVPYGSEPPELRALRANLGELEAELDILRHETRQ